MKDVKKEVDNKDLDLVSGGTDGTDVTVRVDEISTMIVQDRSYGAHGKPRPGNNDDVFQNGIDSLPLK